jgi:hypothetical protein
MENEGSPRGHIDNSPMWPGNDCGIPLLNYIYSVSSGAQNMTLQKYFSHPRLVITFLQPHSYNGNGDSKWVGDY